MDSPVITLPPSSEAASTEGVAQAEAENIELSILTNQSTLPTDASQQESDNSSSSEPGQSRRTSTTWSILKLASISTLSSVGLRSSEIFGRYKQSLYKNLLKILGILCGLGALVLAWLNLKSSMKPNGIEIQSLAAMNRSAGSQNAIYEVLQESLSKLREELANERKQLEVDQESLRNEVDQLQLQKWTAQRQFIKDCLEYQKEKNMTSTKCADAIKAWDEPPPFWSSEITFPQIIRRRPMTLSSSLENSQTPLIQDDTSTRMDQFKAPTKPAPMRISQEPPRLSQKEPSAHANPDTLPSGQIRYLDRFLTHFMIGFIAFIAILAILVYTIRLLRIKGFGKKSIATGSEKMEPARTLPYEIHPAVIRNTATSDDLPVGNRNRRATSTQYRRGDIWTAAYSGSLEAIASFRAENRYTNINEISPRLGTPLHAACQGGQLETAKMLLKWGANPNIQGGRFKTCLVAAAYSGNRSVVRLILDLSVAINEYNEVAGSALHAACERGSQEMVELLVKNGSDVQASGGSYGTPLQAASFRGNPNVVSLLLDNGAEANVKGGQYGSPLHAAAVDGHVEVSELLLEKGADVNFKTETYGTALQVACQGDHTRLARVLIEHGASFDTLDEQNHTPLHHASRIGDETLVETLLKRGVTVNMADADCCTALHYAASNGHTTVTKLLLQHGADPSVRDKFGAQPLFRAAGLTYVEVVKLLIKEGADIDAKDHYGKTALHGPFHDDNIEITDLLLDAGANINDRADDGKTPLHRAAEVANIENLRLLLRWGADLNLEDNDQATPLLTAMKGDCKEASREQLNKVALYLLQQPGIDVNSRSSAAFQEAIALNQMDVVETMLARKVSLNSQGWRCGGIVQAAVHNGSSDLVIRLLNLGANANIQGGEFGTALQAAAYFGNMPILDVLLEHGANVNTRGGRFGYALTAARKGKAKVGTKTEVMRLLKQWGAKEGPVASTHEKERWTLTPSGWVWLPAGTFTISQTTTIAVNNGTGGD